MATSAVEWDEFLKHGNTKVYSRKTWKVFSTCPGLAEAFAPYAIDASAVGKEFTKCRGRLATKNANYTPMMCQTFWQAFCKPRPLPTTAAAANCRGGLSPEEGHREHDFLASTPMWCSLVTRVVKPKSPEAQCDGSRNAMIQELNNINGKEVWDLDDVYSLPDLLKDKNISEAMLGRVFAILGIKGEEVADSLQQWKARIVFQGSNVRTKSEHPRTTSSKTSATLQQVSPQQELPWPSQP